MFHFSPPLNDTQGIDLYFTYQFGNDNATLTQENTLIEPINNLTGVVGHSVSFCLKGEGAGSLVVGIYSTSDEFEE